MLARIAVVAQGHRLDILGHGQRGHHQVGALGDLGDRLGGGAAEIGAGLHRRGVQVEHRHLVIAALDDVAAHGATHVADADETNFHCSLPQPSADLEYQLTLEVTRRADAQRFACLRQLEQRDMLRADARPCRRARRSVPCTCARAARLAGARSRRCGRASGAVGPEAMKVARPPGLRTAKGAASRRRRPRSRTPRRNSSRPW